MTRPVQYVLPTVNNVKNPRSWGYDAALDELLVRLAAGPNTQLQITTAREQAQRVQTETNPEDFVPEYGQIFSRSSFAGGEGLDFAHRADGQPDDRTRFWDSQGVAVFGDSPGRIAAVELLPEMEQIASTGTDTDPYGVLHPDGYILLVDGQSVLKVADPAGTPVVTSEDPFPSYSVNVKHIVAVGTEVWASGDGTSGLSKRSAAGVWSELAGSLEGEYLWYVKSRLLTGVGRDLHVVNETDGTSSAVVHTLPVGHTWLDVIDGGPVILGTDGHHIFMFEDQSGVLTLVNQVKITDSDEPVTMAMVAGVLLIGTREQVTSPATYIGRLYRATVGSQLQNYSLQDIQQIKQWDWAVDAYPTVMYVTRDSVYFAVTESATETWLWRYYAPTGGLARDRRPYTAGASNKVRFIAFFNNLLFAAAGSSGLSRDDGKYVTDGYLILPAADFYTTADKSWLGITTHVEDLTGGGTVDIYYSDDPADLLDPTSPSWRILQSISVTGDAGVEVPLPDIESRWLLMMVKIAAAADQMSTPRVRSIAARAAINPLDVIVALPVNISDRIERHAKRPFTVPGFGEYLFSELLSREGSPVLLQLYAPELTIRGSIESVAAPVLEIGKRGSPTAVCQVTVRGKIVTASTVSGGSTSTSSLIGVGLIGVPTIGV